MVTSLTGSKRSETYPQLLHVDGGIDGTLKTVYDGDGTATGLKVSTESVGTPKIAASTSAGVLLESNSGADVLLLGAGGGANATAYGGWNFDVATANTIATFSDSKTLQSGGIFAYAGVTSSSSAPAGIAFTGTTAPSGAVTYDSSFQQIGKRCSGIISIYYATQASAITNLTMDWPAGWPEPLERGGFTAASMPQYIGRGYAITTTATTLTNGSTFCGIRRNAADTAFEITSQFSSGSYRAFIIQVEWDVA